MLEATRQFVLSAMGSTGQQASFDVEDVLSKLEIDEKIGLVSGIDFWHTFPVHRLGVPSVRLSDGPNGVRGTRFFNGVPAACLPCGEFQPFPAMFIRLKSPRYRPRSNMGYRIDTERRRPPSN